MPESYDENDLMILNAVERASLESTQETRRRLIDLMMDNPEKVINNVTQSNLIVNLLNGVDSQVLTVAKLKEKRNEESKSDRETTEMLKTVLYSIHNREQPVVAPSDRTLVLNNYTPTVVKGELELNPTEDLNYRNFMEQQRDT